MTECRTIAGLGLSLVLMASPAALAQEEVQGLLPVPDYGGDFWNRSHLTGDWGGTRTELANKGVQVDVDWTQYVQGVVDGGLDRKTRYGGHVDYLFHLDLMRMGLIPGGLVTFRAESRYGESVNGISGQILPVNTTALFPLTNRLDEDVAIAITDLNYTQFLSEHLAVLVGKLDTLDADLNEFASGRGKSQFMNANFLFNSALALRLPYSTLGAAALWLPTRNITVNASIINSTDFSTDTGFGDFGDGQTVSVEADFQYRLRGLPGGMNVGGLYSFNQDFNQIGGRLIFQPGQELAVEQEDDTWAVYWSAWQYLFVEDPRDEPLDLHNGVPDREGVGVFARFGVADEDTNPVEWSGSFGVGGRGIIPSRDDDVFGVGYYYTRFQETRVGGLLGVKDHGQGFETFYNAAITPASHLTFDLQLADSALPRTDTAVILGGRLNLSFWGRGHGEPRTERASQAIA
jgi:porin